MLLSLMFYMSLEWQKTFFLEVTKATSLGHVEFGKKNCVITDNGKKVVGFGIKGNFLYWLQCETKLGKIENVRLVVSKQLNNVQLWHKCLGPLGMENVKLLSKRNLVEKINLNKQEELTFCESCHVQGKQHLESFPKEGTLCVDKLFKHVHTNVQGLSKTPSLSKARYFLSFTNNFS